jgi:hypothetical protein
VAEDFGGPVWHASAYGKSLTASKRICADGLRGVGDASLGEWSFEHSSGVWHLIRRLTPREQEEHGVPDPYDIRGTDEERRRIAAVYAEGTPEFRALLQRISP